MIELRAQFRSQHLDATHVAAGFSPWLIQDGDWRPLTTWRTCEGGEKPQRCLEELATAGPLQGPGNFSTFCSGRGGRPRVSGRRMTLNSPSPVSFVTDRKHPSAMASFLNQQPLFRLNHGNLVIPREPLESSPSC